MMAKGKCGECSNPTSRQCCCLAIFYCSQACQAKAWPDHRLNCPAIKVKELPGRGRGLVATRTISRGRTVLFEGPLIMVRKRQGANAEVRRQYQGLTKGQRQYYDSFGAEMTNKQDRVEKIFWRHCVHVVGDLRAMFSRFALVNHSCAGNAVINFTENGFLQLVLARRVEKDQEITVNYLDPYIHRGKGDFFRVNRQATLQSNWGFTCACQVCAASSQQEATNDALKRNLIAYLAKQKKYWDESFWGNLDRIFTLEVAMLDLMRKLELEMIREMPECLLHCYWYGKLVQIIEGRVLDDVGKYLQEGRKLAAMLGPSHERAFLLRERKCDEITDRCVQDLVRERKSRVCYMVAIPAPETSSPPPEADSKQILKGRGRGKRRMSNSQGV